MIADHARATWAGMTIPRFTTGRARRIACLVMHATAGMNSYGWLRKGGAASAPVSCPYLVSKAGQIWQFVREADTAWHAGASQWHDLAYQGSLNACSIGIELENLNDGRDPYPDAQLVSAITLAADIVRRYAIPRINLVRHLDVSPGRKTDPAPPAFDWTAFVEAVYRPVTPSGPRYSEDSPILGTAQGTREHAMAWITPRCKQYDANSLRTIINEYVRICALVGVDWFLAFAQCLHETDHLNSALSGRPYRNPAGIGITGASSTTPQPGYVWDRDRNLYRACVTFPAWTVAESGGRVASVEAHIGRLLAYALKPGQRWGEQTRITDRALSVRDLPLKCHGSAPTLKPLGNVHNEVAGCGWAWPGPSYGASIAALANRMRGL